MSDFTLMRKQPLSFVLCGATILATVAVVALNPTLPTISLSILLICIASAHLLISHRALRAQCRLDQVQRDHKILLESVRYYPMPFALYDENDRLIVWNKAYEVIYANAFGILQDKIDNNELYYADLLRCNIDGTMSESEVETFIRTRIAEQRDPSGSVYDRNYPGHGWYRVSKHHTPSGAVAGFAIDINEMKRREVELMEEVEHRKKLEQEVRKLAYTDALTGVANRRAFLEVAEAEFNFARKNGNSLFVLMLDIDHFKNINDTFGHAVGDDVIKQITNLAKINLKNDDLLGRLGGEEFAILIRNSITKAAFQSAEDVRIRIADHLFESDRQSFHVTVSIGLGELSAHDDNFSDTLKQADDLLYEAKLDGRNCTVIKSKKLDKTG